MLDDRGAGAEEHRHASESDGKRQGNHRDADDPHQQWRCPGQSWERKISLKEDAREVGGHAQERWWDQP